MGTWGPAIFSDDLACDVRDEWRGLIGEGVSPEEATARIVAGYSASFSDPDERGVVVLALALAQWKTGRLAESVRGAALEVIDSGADLARWAPGPQRNARERALAKARAELLSPQPPAKKIAKRRLSHTPFVPGDVVRYEHDSGMRFLFWVEQNTHDQGGSYSVAEVLDFVGRDVPDLADAVRLRAMECYEYLGDRAAQSASGLCLLLIHASRLFPDRATVIGNQPWPGDRSSGLASFAYAKDLDDWLRPFLPGGDHVLRRLPAGEHSALSGVTGRQGHPEKASKMDCRVSIASRKGTFSAMARFHSGPPGAMLLMMFVSPIPLFPA